MAKGTITFLIILALIATLLLGINIGKKLGISQSRPKDDRPLAETTTPSPTLTLTPTVSASPSSTVKKTTATTTYTDNSCGFSFSYPGSFIKEKSANGQATIMTDPDNKESAIVATCAASIPRPPVTSDKIESITLDKTAATLYHDQKTDGTPRDEVIVKHPNNGMEIFLAGFGETFQSALYSFKFIK